MTKKLSQHSILIVDDEEDLIEILRSEFERIGLKVFCAFDGLEGLEIYKREPIDLILCDLRMPRMDGLALLDEVKKSNIDKPVFLFATSDRELTLEEAYDRGSEAIFLKPFDLKTLRTAVLQFLGGLHIEQPNKELAQKVLNLTFDLSNLNSQREQKIRLGRGGMLVILNSLESEVGDLIKFEISFCMSDISIGSIKGTGQIKWIQRVEQLHCGIEFIDLDQKPKDLISKLDSVREERAYIPRAFN